MKNLSIKIPEPCLEDWSQMSPVEQGRHCMSCQKTVVDFTPMSNHGIVEYIKSHEGSLCGRFYKDQLDINLLPARKNKWYAKYAALLIGILPITALGQDVVQKTERNVIKGERVMSEKTDKKEFRFEGQLIDSESKEAILFATIALHNREHRLVEGVETDFNGKFSMIIKQGEYVDVSYIGYENMVFCFDDIKNMKGKYIFEIKESVVQDAPFVKGNVNHNEDTQDIKKVTLDAVEIVGYKVPVIKGGVSTSCTVTGAMSTVYSEPESWLKRTWKKLKKIVNVTYDEAQRVNKENKANRIHQEEYTEQENLRFVDAVEGVPVHIAPYITIAPNPNQGIFKIQLPANISNGVLQILSSANELIYSQKVESQCHEVDISQYASGTYIVTFVVDQELVVSEVFVKI